MSLQSIVATLTDLPLSHYIRESAYGFQAFETIHVVAFVFVVGAIAVLDLRLLGVASKDVAVTELARDTLKWTWLAFAIAFLSGGVLLMAKLNEYMVVEAVWVKYLAMAAAGVNMLIFELITMRNVKDWDTGPAIPRAAKIAGGLSLFFWAVVIICGRWIGFMLGGAQVFGYGW